MGNSNFEEEIKARRELIKWGKELYELGLVKGSGGNLSIRLSDNTILLTPTGYFLGHMTEECISKCTIDGEWIDGAKPTKEVPLHTAVYKTRPNVNAVCHTHSVYAVAFASTVDPETVMPVCEPGVAAKVGLIKVKGFAMPGSVELGKGVEEGLAESNAVLLANHGVVAVGKDMGAAVEAAYEVENNAIIYSLCGEKVRFVPEEDVKELIKKVKL